MMIAPIVVGLMWRYMYHPSVGIINRTLERMGFDPIPWLSDRLRLAAVAESPRPNSTSRGCSRPTRSSCSRHASII